MIDLSKTSTRGDYCALETGPVNPLSVLIAGYPTKPGYNWAL